MSKTSSLSDELQLIDREWGVRYPDGHVERMVNGESNAIAVADLVSGTVTVREVFRSDWRDVEPDRDTLYTLRVRPVGRGLVAAMSKRTYTAVCRRVGEWWAVDVPEIRGVHTQARRLDQVESMTRDAIALLNDVAPTSFDVKVEPVLEGEVEKTVVAATEASERARAAAEEAGQAFRCDCGGNVFRRAPGDTFVCNSCKTVYEGDRNGG